jgi:hypothetical protein
MALQAFYFRNCDVRMATLAVLTAVAALNCGGQSAAPQTPLVATAIQPDTAAAQQAADKAAAIADHQQMLDQLGIKELRSPASHDLKSPNAVNYDEAKANPYGALPDPLVLRNGKRVPTAKLWWQQRRPEIVELFDREVLGRAPANAPKVDWQVTNQSNETAAGIPVVVKHLSGKLDNSAYPVLTVAIDLLVVTPAEAKAPVPVVMELAFDAESMAIFAHMIPEMTPGGKGNEGPSWQEQVLKRGWGYAILLPTSFQADSGAGMRQGVIGLANKGQSRQPDDWGAIRAWAWGASRAMDYLETDKAVDAKRVAIEGHSRFGKTALTAMAYDQRFRVAYISSSGTGGTKPYRHVMGEQLENLAGAPTFYYWMGGNFLKYAGPLTTGDLPLDANELIALCAPRPVFIGVGSTTAGDAWADPVGEFMGASGAGPVYRLLGKKDLGTAQMPPMETPLVAGDLAFRQHRFGHTPGPNWPFFLDFAARYLEPGKDK